jgi:hypothetical protein
MHKNWKKTKKIAKWQAASWPWPASAQPHPAQSWLVIAQSHPDHASNSIRREKGVAGELEPKPS